MEGADQRGSHLGDTPLWDIHLKGTNLTGTKFSPDFSVEDADWGNYILVEEKDRYFNAAVASY